MKILTVAGARPQFIKMAPISLALRDLGHEEISVHTGQHYDPEMSDIFYQELGLKEPDHNLEAGSGSHGAQTGRILMGLEPIVRQTLPDAAVVIGDTNSTLAGALVAAKLHVPLAHVEAGLRSHNRRMPEELNRVCADHVSDRLYYSTRTARENLQREGLLERGREVGDVTLDAIRIFSGTAIRPETERLMERTLGGPFVLLTLHRAENTDEPERLRRIWQALSRIPWPLLFPIHPRTRIAAERLGLLPGERMHLLEPVGYPAMLHLLRRASLLLTDSGGLQKEAYFFRRPCLTLRTETEWVETVEAGWNRLYDLERCPDIDPETESRRQGRDIPEYGDGHAAAHIVKDLETWVGAKGA